MKIYIKLLKAVTLTALCSSFLFLWACQPTPKSAPVVKKDIEVLENKINEENLPINNFIGDDYENKFINETTSENNGKLKISINAPLEFPKTNKCSVYAVKPIDIIPQETIKSLLSGYFNDEKLLAETPYTQEELKVLIVKEKSKLNALQLNDELSANEKEMMTNDSQTKIKTLETELINAPITAELIPLNTDITQGKIMGYSNIDKERVFIEIESENGRNIVKFCKDKNAYFPFTEGLVYENIKMNLSGIKNINSDEAKQKAEAIVNNINFGTFKPLRVEVVAKRGDVGVAYEDEYAYCVSFSKVIDGISLKRGIYWQEPEVANENAKISGLVSSDKFASFLENEKLYVYVNDNGVIQLDYLPTYEIVEQLNENVKIIDFNTLKEVLVKHLKNTFAWQQNIFKDDNSVNVISNNIIVEKINLEYIITPKPNDASQSLIIPVFNVYGNVHAISQIKDENGTWIDYDSNDDETELKRRNLEDKPPLISINAIDGSMIYTPM